jgi:Sec-independent protein translocase protein TatA
VISLTAFLLLMGLIVFGPKKTIEMAQTLGRAVAQVKQSLGPSPHFIYNADIETVEDPRLTSSPPRCPTPEAAPTPPA